MRFCSPMAVWLYLAMLASPLVGQAPPTSLPPRVTASLWDAQHEKAVLATEGALQILSLRGSADGTTPSGSKSEKPSESFDCGRDLPSIQSIEVPFSQIARMDFSPDKKYLLIAGGDPGQRGAVQCIQWPSTSPVRLFETQADGAAMPDVVTGVEWFPGGIQWIESHWAGSALVRRSDGSVLVTFSGHTGPVLSAIPWTDELAISSGLDQTIKLWRIADGTLVRSLDNHTAAVTQLIRWTSPEAKALLISMGQDRTVRLWDPLIGRLIRFARLPDVPVKMTVSDSGLLVVLLENGSVCKLSIPSLRIVETVLLGEPRATTLIQTGPSKWWFW